METLCRLLRAAALGVLAGLLAACAGPGARYGPGTGFFDTVVVDAGHGGHDRGARAVSGSMEKHLALDTARRLAQELRGRGLRVLETRRGDYFVPLSQRVEVSNRTPRSIFVSIHYNWARRRKASGIEIFYCSERSERLAANILRETLRAYPAANRGIKAARFYVLRNNRRPAVLCELGFLSNPRDNAQVQQPEVRQRIASKIADGIMAERAGRVP